MRRLIGVFILVSTFILLAGCAPPGNSTPDTSFGADLELPIPPVAQNNEGGKLRASENAVSNSSPDKQEVVTDTLVIQPECDVLPGSDASFLVTFQGKPVSKARVFLNAFDIGNTSDEGRISAAIPYDYEITLKAEKGELEGRLYIEPFEEAGG
jgi:hypothetical protein